MQRTLQISSMATLGGAGCTRRTVHAALSSSQCGKSCSERNSGSEASRTWWQGNFNEIGNFPFHPTLAHPRRMGVLRFLPHNKALDGQVTGEELRFAEVVWLTMHTRYVRGAHFTLPGVPPHPQGRRRPDFASKRLYALPTYHFRSRKPLRCTDSAKHRHR